MRSLGWIRQAFVILALVQLGGCSNGSDGGGVLDLALPGGGDGGVGDDGGTGSTDLNSGADLAPDDNPNRLTLLVGGLGGPGFQDATADVARFDNPMGMALDGAGNLYVADYNNNAIRKVVLSTSLVSTLAGGTSGSANGIGRAAQFSEPVGLAYDGQGSLYVAEYGGDTIRKIDLATSAVTTFAGSAYMGGNADGVGSAARFAQLKGLTYDGAGHLYAATGVAVRQIDLTTAAVTTLAGGGTPGSKDGVGSAAQVQNLAGIVSDRGDNLYVAEPDTNKIRQVIVSTKTVSTLAGGSVAGATDGRGTAARFNQPSGLALDGAGSLFVMDTLNSQIRKIVLATADVTTLSGTSTNSGSQDGPVGTALYWRPQGAVWAGAGTLYVADTANNTLRKVDLGGGNVTTPAGKARESANVANSIGQGAAVRLANAHSVASDGAGNLYLFGGNVVTQVAIATATASVLAGKFGMRGTADGVGTAANFYNEQGITADRKGNLFVIDGSAIRQVVIASGTVSTLVGNITAQGYVDGSGTTARLNAPYTLVSDGNDTLYVAEANGSTVRKVVVSTKTVSTLAGSNGVSGYVNGVGSAAQFSNPYGIACDSTSVYVTEYYSNWVRKIDLATTNVTTFAGSMISGYTDANGAAARFYAPFGLAADGLGNVYVADKGNGMIRKIAVASGAVTTAVGILNHKGVRTGGIPAPSSLNCPTGMAALASGQLAIYDSCEGTLLIANGL